jgi:choice-of-anchor A domain-containing protein
MQPPASLSFANRIARYLVLAVSSLLTFGFSQVKAQSYTWENYNAIIFGNLNIQGEIEGRTLVGGNLTGSNSSNFGIGLPSGTSATDKTLVVGGNISSGNPLQLNKGSLYLGGTNGRTVNYNGGGSQISQSTDLSTLKQAFLSESANLKSLATDSVVTSSTNGQPGPVTFTATAGSDGLAVFSISADAIFGSNLSQQIGLVANGATNIVINVSGTTVNWIQNAGNMVGDFTSDYWQAHIVWNFYEATTINLGSHQFNGSILAPNATITTSNNIDGAVIANNLNLTGEVHLPSSSSANSYAGYRAQAVPEPGSALLLAVAGLIILTRRRSNLRR